MKLLSHASTQIQLSYLRICRSIFHFFVVPIDLPTVSVCTVLCTYSTSIGISTYSYGYDVRVPSFGHTRTVSVSLLLRVHCNRNVHNFDLGLNWGANLKILL